MFKQITISLTFICFLGAGIAVADTEAVRPLKMVSDLELPGVATKIGFLDGDARFYVASELEPNSALSILNVPTITEQNGELFLEATDKNVKDAIVLELNTSLVDVAITPSSVIAVEGEFLGKSFETYTFTEYSYSLDVIDFERREIEGVPGKLTIDRNGSVFLPVLLPETRSGRVIEALSNSEKSDVNRIRLIQPSHQFWRLPETDMFIVNRTDQASLSLMRLRDASILEAIESIGYSTSGVAELQFQYAVDLRPATSECGFLADPNPIVLLADYSLGTVTALRFDSFFNNFNIFSNVQIHLDSSRPYEASVFAGTPYHSSPFIVAASCDRQRILIGSRSSDELFELSVNSKLEVMEVVQVHKLGFEPGAIAVSTDGKRALVADQDLHRLRVFAEGPTSIAHPVTDSDIIRKIQRELTVQGYPTGPIDGAVGKQTRFALELWEDDTGVNLPNEDLVQTLSVLTSWTNRSVDRIIVGGEPDVPLNDLREHHLSLGWQDLGAHFFVATNGEVLEGRSMDLTPAFSLGSNFGTIAIALTCSEWTEIPNRPTGGCEFNLEQIQAAQSLINGLSERFQIAPEQVELRSRLRGFTPLLEPIFDQLAPQ